MSRNENEFHIFQVEPVAVILAILNAGRTGTGVFGIHASRQGYRITMDGTTVARGGTPHELAAAMKSTVGEMTEGTQQ